MHGGHLVAQGPPADVITEELVEQVFGLHCIVVPDPVAGTPMVVPIGRHHDLPAVTTHAINGTAPAAVQPATTVP